MYGMKKHKAKISILPSFQIDYYCCCCFIAYLCSI